MTYDEDYKKAEAAAEAKYCVVALEVWAKGGYIGGDMCNACAIETIKGGDLMLSVDMEKERDKW